jgi:hypothetical protein
VAAGSGAARVGVWIYAQTQQRFLLLLLALDPAVDLDLLEPFLHFFFVGGASPQAPGKRSLHRRWVA